MIRPLSTSSLELLWRLHPTSQAFLMCSACLPSTLSKTQITSQCYPITEQTDYTSPTQSTDPVNSSRLQTSLLKIDAPQASSSLSYKQTSSTTSRALITQTLKSFRSHSTFVSRTKKSMYQMTEEIIMYQTSLASAVHQTGYQTATKEPTSNASKGSQKQSKSHSLSRRRQM